MHHYHILKKAQDKSPLPKNQPNVRGEQTERTHITIIHTQSLQIMTRN